MRRLLPVLVLMLTVLPLGGFGAAFAGEAKEFKAEGVNWALPDGWSFGPVSSDEKNAGFFAKVECSSASVEVWAYAKATDGLSMDERVAELKEAGGEGMGSVGQTKILDTTLSGVKAKVIVQSILAEGGVRGHFRKYVMVANDRFYQLLMRCWHGANESVKDEINELRAGFRLQKGGGGKDAPEALDEVGGGEAGKDGAHGKDGDDGSSGTNDKGAEEGDWPPNGPERSGNTVKMHNHNLEWTLPDKGAFEWAGAIEDGKAESGRFVIARARVEREKQEFEKGTPDHNFGLLDMIIEKAPPGFKAADWVRGVDTRGVPAVREIVSKKYWGLLDEIDATKTRTKDEVKFGNHTAAYIKMEGDRGPQKRVVMLFAVVLRGKLYVTRAICWGHTDAYKQMAPNVGKALSGINFLKTDEPVRGPLLIDTVPDFAGDRGEDADKEKEYAGPGYVFEKPEGMAHIKATNSMNRDLKFAGEGRSEDGKAYLYFEIRAYQLNIANTPNPDEEKFIEKRAQDWEAGAGAEVDIGGGVGKKLKFKKGKFGKAKGLTYEFEGHLEEEPVIEEGYVVKYKNWMLWIKMQYIGQDAEGKMKNLAKDVKKGLKYNR